MDNLKKLFPLSFRGDESVKDLVIGILIHLVVGIVAALLIWVGGFVAELLSFLPIVGALLGWVLRIVGIVVDLYIIAGIVLEILVYCKVINE